MGKTRPLAGLLLLQVLACCWLAGWWCSRPAAERLQRLAVVMRREQVPTAPPDGLWAQGEWLLTHRATQLTGLVGLLAVALVMGVGEGIARRHTDVLGGFLVRWWTLGRAGLALLPGAGVGVLVAPWPLPLVWVAGVLALLVAVVGYGLTAGRPYVP